MLYENFYDHATAATPVKFLFPAPHRMHPLRYITFYGDSGSSSLGTAAFSSGNSLELVPVPEPGALMGSAVLVGYALTRRRRGAALNSGTTTLRS